MRIAEKVDFRPDSPVESGFHDIGYDEVFIEAAAQGIARRLFRRVDAEQKRGKPDIREIYFRGFDDALADILEERLKLEHNVRRFQNPQPGFDCCAGYADIVRERCEVDNLSDPARQQSQEFLERRQFAKLGQSADVALDISLNVAVEKPARFKPLFVKSWIESLNDQVERGFGVLIAAEFGKRERPQSQHGGTAGKRLAYRLMQLRLMAAGQNETAPPAALIDNALNV